MLPPDIYHEEFGRFTQVCKPRRHKPVSDAQPKRRGKHHAEKKTAAKLVLDQDKTLEEAVVEADLKSVQTVKTAVAHEEGRREVLTELLDAAASKKFSEKGELKIEDAIRVHKVRIDKQFEERVNAEVRRRIDAADDATRANNKKLLLENIGLQRIIQERGVFTLEQYNLLRRALHPDRVQRFGDAEMVEEFKIAAQLLAEKKNRLVFLEKKK